MITVQLLRLLDSHSALIHHVVTQFVARTTQWLGVSWDAQPPTYLLVGGVCCVELCYKYISYLLLQWRHLCGGDIVITHFTWTQVNQTFSWAPWAQQTIINFMEKFADPKPVKPQCITNSSPCTETQYNSVSCPMKEILFENKILV